MNHNSIQRLLQMLFAKGAGLEEMACGKCLTCKVTQAFRNELDAVNTTVGRVREIRSTLKAFSAAQELVDGMQSITIAPEGDEAIAIKAQDYCATAAKLAQQHNFPAAGALFGYLQRMMEGLPSLIEDYEIELNAARGEREEAPAK